jgi:hypothetical protein
MTWASSFNGHPQSKPEIYRRDARRMLRVRCLQFAPPATTNHSLTGVSPQATCRGEPLRPERCGCTMFDNVPTRGVIPRSIHTSGPFMGPLTYPEEES